MTLHDEHKQFDLTVACCSARHGMQIELDAELRKELNSRVCDCAVTLPMTASSRVLCCPALWVARQQGSKAVLTS